MKRLTFTSVVSLLCLFAFGQATEDIMVIEKKDATTLRVNVEDIQRVVFEAVNIIPTGTVNGHEWIDLGLPSGTKWATCNVGASKPEEYGGYYAWGETKTKNEYVTKTYQHYYSQMVYGNIGSDIAGTPYDAATANWGAPWSMPTLEQIQELLNYTSSQRTQQNGVSGQKFTGPNGGTIFLPNAGNRWDDFVDGETSYGLYWSSSLYPDNSNWAYSLYFDMTIVSGHGYYDRIGGLSVRPVLKN